MGMIYGEISIARPVSQVYAYLKNRYNSDVFESICKMTKGYVPKVECLEEVEDERLSFRVPARDTVLLFRIGSWTWSYQLTAIGDGLTKVGITYEWGIWLDLVTMFTAKHQAANELVETALAIDALTGSAENS